MKQSFLVLIMLFWSHLVIAQDNMVYNYLQEDEPLNSFLESPIKELSISLFFGGCYNHASRNITYKKTKRATLQTKHSSYQRNDLKEKNTYENQLSHQKLLDVLILINKHKDNPPSIKDFNIITTDEEKYLTYLDDFKMDSTRKIFYQNIVQKLDTIQPQTLIKALQYQPNLIYISAYTDLEVTIRNNENISIKIKKEQLLIHNTWNLPLTISYQDKYFKCYHPALIQFLMNCVPNDSELKKQGFEYCHNKYLIKQIADYLYHQQQE